MMTYPLFLALIFVTTFATSPEALLKIDDGNITESKHLSASAPHHAADDENPGLVHASDNLASAKSSSNLPAAAESPSAVQQRFNGPNILESVKQLLPRHEANGTNVLKGSERVTYELNLKISYQHGAGSSSEEEAKSHVKLGGPYATKPLAGGTEDLVHGSNVAGIPAASPYYFPKSSSSSASRLQSLLPSCAGTAAAPALLAVTALIFLRIIC